MTSSDQVSSGTPPPCFLQKHGSNDKKRKPLRQAEARSMKVTINDEQNPSTGIFHSRAQTLTPQSCIDTQMNHKLSMQQDREPLDDYHFRCQHRPIYTIGEGTKPNQPNITEFCDVSICFILAVGGCDFSKYFAVYHNYWPMETITPYEAKTFFLDSRLIRCGTTKRRQMYLISDKITDLGSSVYKDFLPLLVMSSRIN
uniref:Uncharacterized protein n=1 Tax=Glossina austeni TaxID=7395 RepID=A0A1A9UPD5_GLOAU